MKIDAPQIGSEGPAQGGVENRRKKRRIWDFLEGRSLEMGISRRALRWSLALLGTTLFLIYNNYVGMMRVRQLSDLNKELTELRVVQVSVSTDLMHATRLSNIEQRLHEEGLTLSVPKTSPIIVEE